MNEETNISNNSEIEKALKQFEAESQAGQSQKVPEASKAIPVPQKEVEGVKFEVPSYGAVKYYKETDVPKMVKVVMKISGGAIKDQKQAEYILLGFVIVAIGISVFLFGKSLSGEKSTLTAEQKAQINKVEQFQNNNIKP